CRPLWLELCSSTLGGIGPPKPKGRATPMRTRARLTIVTALLSIASALPARAAEITLSFFNITGNSAVDAGIGEAQLSVTVRSIDGSPNQVDFVFTNSGPAASSITDIYFEDG